MNILRSLPDALLAHQHLPTARPQQQRPPCASTCTHTLHSNTPLTASPPPPHQAKLTQQAQELAHAQKQLARSVRASRSSSGHGEVLALELRGAREQLGREQQELAACRRQLAEVQAQQQRAVEQLAGLQVRGGVGAARLRCTLCRLVPRRCHMFHAALVPGR